MDLAIQASEANISLTIDAEEIDRLNVLDIFSRHISQILFLKIGKA